MTWAFPGAAIFLALIPPLILLYFLRLKRREVIVSSTMLWSRVLEDRRVNSPFQRFRRSLLLLLQLLLLLFLIAGLAQPQHETTLEEERTVLLLFDVSASMGTDEGGETRLEIAKERGRQYVEGLGDKERAVVIQFSNRASSLSPVTDDRRELLRAIDSLRVLPATTSVDEAIELAVSISRNLTDGIAVIFSDGGFPAWEGDEISLPVEYQPIGVTVENSGITALSARVDFSNSTRPQVYVEVRNDGAVPARGVLSVFQGGDLIRAAEPEKGIEPDGVWSRSFEADVEGLVEVQWEPEGEDALATDNKAWIEIAPRREIVLWLVGKRNLFLDGVLGALPDVKVREVGFDRVTALLEEEPNPPEVILWNGEAPEQLPSGCGHLFLGAVPTSVWPNAELVEYPPVISWDRSHPTTRFISFGKLVVSKGQLLTPEPTTTPVLESRGGALISAFAQPGARGVVVSFDPVDSTWALDISFPLFMHNAVTFLSEASVGPVVGVRSGELISLRGRRGVPNYKIDRPDGRTDTIEPDREGWMRYAQTDVLGAYTVTWSETQQSGLVTDQSRVVPVNLLDARETDIVPREELQVAGRKIAGQVDVQTSQREYWPWLLAVALLLLMVEWYYYHLR